MTQKILCKTVDDLDFAAEKLLNTFPDKRIFAFYGELGAGKTTFIKAICKILKVKDIVNSPSFSIINEYKTSDNESVFHFDFFRIKDINEVLDIGYEDYFYSNSYCLIEWPEKIGNLLAENFVCVKIEKDKTKDSRTIKF